MLYPQNGDRIVAIDSVTSLHPMYSFSESYLYIPDVSKTFSKPLRILNETLNDG